MDLSTISKCYKLIDREVKPDHLLLDPNNPRIVLAIDAKKEFTETQLASDDIQDYILSIIKKDEFHISDLINGIKSTGFRPLGNDIVVKAIPNTKKYLVLEGNRRTTAIKYLLTQRDDLKPVVLETLQNIRVKEFVFSPGNGFEEEEAINIYLGGIHITGALGWGALEKAHYIYKNYLRVLNKDLPDLKSFRYITQYGQEVADQFNLKENAVRVLIQVYQVYQQLKSNKYEAYPHHYTLIEMAVKDSALRDKYFGMNENTFHFSNQGLERLYKLCIDEGKPINNPSDFRAFSKIFRHGTEYQVSCVESGDELIADILSKVNNKLDDCAFLNDLLEIKEQLRGLRPADYRGIGAEIDTITQIKKIVDEKLYPLTKKK